MKLVRSKTTKHVRVANAISGTRAQYYVIDACNCYELRQKRENGMARHPDHAERASERLESSLRRSTPPPPFAKRPCERKREENGEKESEGRKWSGGGESWRYGVRQGRR